jgi:putative FmdB family regulatory protein
MPIYAYRCAACGHAQDVLQRMSDPQLTTCPSCGAEAYSKQVTAAGFQLKGSGWYATDFRNGNNAPAKPAEGGEAKPAGDAKPADAKPADSKPVQIKPAGESSSAAASASATAPAPAPAAAAKPPASGS